MSTDDDYKSNTCMKFSFNNLFDPEQKIFVEYLKPDFKFASAYYDPSDGLPVLVVKVLTDKASQNERGEMHTGAFLLMMDSITSYASLSDMRFYEFPDNTIENVQFNPERSSRLGLEMGISRTLKVHRNRAIPCGSTIYIASKMVENTPTSTFTTCMVFSEDGKSLATGQHDKTKSRKAVKPKL